MRIIILFLDHTHVDPIIVGVGCYIPCTKAKATAALSHSHSNTT